MSKQLTLSATFAAASLALLALSAALGHFAPAPSAQFTGAPLLDLSVVR